MSRSSNRSTDSGGSLGTFGAGKSVCARVAFLLLVGMSVGLDEAACQQPCTLLASSYEMLRSIEDECDRVGPEILEIDGCCATKRSFGNDWHLLPDGLLWHSYLASPHEPRISTIIFQDDNEGVFWDATLGGRVGLLRYGTAGANRPSGWQWDLEGAVMTRLDVLNSEDVESADYRFGTLITASEGPWGLKFGYFHISSHVGDEYLDRNPGFVRINYVTESWIVGGSYLPSESTRVYGELVNSFHVAGGAKRYQIQTGAEYTPVAKAGHRCAPFAAVNWNFRQAVDYDASTTLQFGWSLQGRESQRRLRFGVQCGAGPTSQYSFFQRREKYIGIGTWFDY